MMPLAPIYLIGLLAAGIPLLLHLIHRRQAQKVMFPTIRFLKLSNERTAHRRHIQNLLLLVMRTLLFVVLAVALAQFIVKLTEGAGLLRAKAYVVIVVDNSYSMAAVHEGRSRYEGAKEAALAILREMHSSDEAAAIFTSGPERRLESKLSADAQEVQNAINRSNVSAEGGSVLAALREAQDMLIRRKTELREIYVLTDLQKLAWETGPKWGELSAETPLAREERGRIPVIVFDAGRDAAENLAVREIRVSGQAFVKGALVTVDADIYYPGQKQLASTLVSLFVGGEAKGKRKLDLAANSTATASFTCELPASGIATIQVRLPDDALPVDNERSYKLEVKEKIGALIVQDAASAVSFLDQSYFLERALDPSIALGGPSTSIIRPGRVLLKDLARVRLADYDVVFLLNVRTMPDAVAGALREFVRNGGGLIFFAGEDLDPKEYARLFARSTPLLPLALEPIDKAPPERSRFMRVTSLDESHFVFAPFRGLNIMKGVRVYKSARVNLHVPTPMQALAQLADGQPLVLAHSCSKGKVVFAAVTADASWSNLPVTDAFLPMIHRIVYYACGALGEADSLAVGAPYRFNFPETAARVDIDIRRPDGIEETISTAPTPDANEAVYAQTFKPGCYTFTTRGGVVRSGAFVVNPDTAESNLERVSAGELEKHLAPSVVRVCSNIGEMQKSVTPLREGVQLRDLFILVAIIIAVFESVISNWATPRGETKKQSTLLPVREGEAKGKQAGASAASH